MHYCVVILEDGLNLMRGDQQLKTGDAALPGLYEFVNDLKVSSSGVKSS